jgi:hypothetical protein
MQMGGRVPLALTEMPLILAEMPLITDDDAQGHLSCFDAF